METPGDFGEYYRTHLLPVLEELEARRKAVSKTFRVIVVSVVVVVSSLAFAVWRFSVHPAVLLAALLVGVAVCAISWLVLTRGFVPEFKRRVIGGIVRFCDPGLTYTPERHVSRSRFQGSEVFQHTIDRFRGEDHVCGRIGATEVEFSEVHAEYKTTTRDSKGHTTTHWHTIFKGLFFIADFNKHFRGTTVVLPDAAERIFGFLGSKLQSMNFMRGELVKLEDPEFEREFVVYGDDQIEARYILSTSLMARITDFKRRTGKQTYLSFARSNVHVAISTDKDMFEPRIFRTLLDPALIEDYLHDLQLALGIVEDLDLNTRIWTKE
jgi:hypothetical protein